MFERVSEVTLMKIVPEYINQWSMDPFSWRNSKIGYVSKNRFDINTLMAREFLWGASSYSSLFDITYFRKDTGKWSCIHDDLPF